MSRVRQKDTRPEMLLRQALWKAGIRYRKTFCVAGIKVDVAVPRRSLAIFVDGCFWHGCPSHYTSPQQNGAFWRQKIAANQSRDAGNNMQLGRLGWTVLRVWECEVEKDLAAVVDRVWLAMTEESRSNTVSR